MNTAIVWVLLTFSCEGHVNARCWPVIETYSSKEACKERLRGPDIVHRSFFGNLVTKVEPGRPDKSKICLPLAGIPVTAE